MNVILIDDEHLALIYLEQMLKKIPDVHVAKKFLDPLPAKEYIRKHRVDVAFLDIHMPEINGIEMAEKLAEIDPNIIIAFVTAYDDYAIQAFEMNAIDYVMKPVGPERLAKTVQRIRSRLGETAANAGGAAVQPQTIRIKLFQHLSVESEKDRFTPMRWRTLKAQELFLYLLQHRNMLVPKSTLAELLWGDSEPEKAYAQLYTAVYHIRKTLAPFGGRFQIANVSEGYILKTEGVVSDTEEWQKGITLPDTSVLDAKTVGHWEEIMALYTGDYLQDYDYWWAESESQRLKSLWVRTAYRMARWYEQSDQLDKAIEKYQAIISRQSTEEQAHFALMQIYASLNQSVSVHRQYRLLVSTVAEEFNTHPSEYITEWYDDWVQQET